MTPAFLTVALFAMLLRVGLSHRGPHGAPRQAGLRGPPSPWCKRQQGVAEGLPHGHHPSHHPKKAHKCDQVFHSK